MTISMTPRYTPRHVRLYKFSLVRLRPSSVTSSVTMLGRMSFSSTERRRLADLLLKLGPDAPTLCEGWNTKDLATHLLLRETRPWLAFGLAKNAAAKVGEREYGGIVKEWAAGPGTFNPLRLVDGLVNTAEHFVHHEDVRRGSGEIVPRDFSQAVEKQLHQVLTLVAPRMLAKSATPVVLYPTGHGRVLAAERRGVSEDGESVVGVSGDVGELVLWVFGRDAVRISIEGNISDALRSSL